MYSQTTPFSTGSFTPVATPSRGSACTNLRSATAPESPRRPRSASHPDAVVVVPVEMLPLHARDLDTLDPADRLLAERLPLEPIEYVDHPAFHEPQAEQRFFGGLAVLAPGSARFIEMSHDDEPCGSHLDAAAEQIAFQRFNFARMQMAEIIRAHHRRQLSPLSLRTLLGWMHRVLEIRSQLARANMALVISMARRPQFAGLDSSEVISAGNLGLLRSIDRFDCSRGYKFSTYACQSIIQRILHVVESVQRYRSHFTTEYDQTLDRDDSSARRHAADQEDWIDALRDILVGNQARLTDLECLVVRKRFGLTESPEDRPMTLQEVGRFMGVTKERVRQIQKRALMKLRLAMQFLMG